jgi:hypothetical protein
MSSCQSAELLIQRDIAKRDPVPGNAQESREIARVWRSGWIPPRRKRVSDPRLDPRLAAGVVARRSENSGLAATSTSTCARRLVAPAVSGGSDRTVLDSSSPRGCSPTAANIHCFPTGVWLVTDAS